MSFDSHIVIDTEGATIHREVLISRLQRDDLDVATLACGLWHGIRAARGDQKTINEILEVMLPPLSSFSDEEIWAAEAACAMTVSQWDVAEDTQMEVLL